jgi:FkbM family methyltransferase
LAIRNAIKRAIASTAPGRRLLERRRQRGLLALASHAGLTLTTDGVTQALSDGVKTMILNSPQAVRLQSVIQLWTVLTCAVEETCLDFTKPGWFTLSDTKRRILLNSFTESEAIARQSVECLEIEPGMTVLDIGANVGLLSLILAEKVGPNGRVLAVEADPENFKCLQRNVAGNPTVTPLHCAVWAHDGHVSFDAQGTTMSAVKDGPEYQAVPCLKLETIAARHSPIDVIKMDIEGGEFAVLPAARSLIARGNIQWVIEIHGGRHRVEMLAPLFTGYAVAVDHNGHLPMMVCVPRTCD